LVESKEEFAKNDSIDFFHAIVPTAYADYVVLDNKWGGRMRRFNVYGAATIFKISEITDFLKAIS